jgi:hypothetical protein
LEACKGFFVVGKEVNMKERRNYQEQNNPFSSEKSGYGRLEGNTLHSVYAAGSERFAFHQKAHTYFRDLVLDPGFACIAGQGAVRSKTYAFSAYGDMRSEDVAEGVCHDLFTFKQEFGLSTVSDRLKFMTFIAAFEHPKITNQLDGAEHFYTLLHNMHQHDVKKERVWNPSVSKDIHSPEFGFSSGGDAFFVPLLYPHSGSPARRSDITMVVFNAHAVFDKLRETGAFDKIKQKIRARQDWVHPYLGDHGETNEFLQYALVDPDEETQRKNEQIIYRAIGKCPFGKD